jgi:hypothetical protein
MNDVMARLAADENAPHGSVCADELLASARQLCRAGIPENKRLRNQRGLEMIKAQGGIFGWVSNAQNFIAAIS